MNHMPLRHASDNKPMVSSVAVSSMKSEVPPEKDGLMSSCGLLLELKGSCPEMKLYAPPAE